MKKKNKINKSIHKLDPTSDRYRICPYCQEPHMVNHLSKDYCCDEHADAHYNEKRRLQKHAESMLNKKDKIFFMMPSKCNNNETPKLIDEEEEKTVAEPPETVFDTLKIDPDKGTVFHIKALEAIGVDLFKYSTKINLGKEYNGQKQFAVMFKNYKITRVKNDKVHVQKVINFKQLKKK